MKDIKALLFDVDGTLLDTHEFIYQAFETGISLHGHEMKTRQDVNVVMGQSLEACYTNLTGCTDLAAHVEAHRGFQEQNYHLSVPFENTVATLLALKQAGLKLAVLTTRHKRTSIQTLKNAGIFEFFDLVLSGDDIQNIKPHPESIEKALAFLEVAPSDAVMIGDTKVDILAGKKAGTKTIGVTYGFGKDIRQYNPDFVVEDIGDILKIFEV